MSHLLNFEVYLGLINFFTMCGNIYWAFKLKGDNYWKERAEELKDQLEKKNAIIHAISRKKDQYKYQYQNLLASHQKLEGSVKTYQDFHNHPKV